jgi:hypothetical protein
MDMIEQDERLDARKVILTGCSRLGKAALIAGAFDERHRHSVEKTMNGTVRTRLNSILPR